MLCLLQVCDEPHPLLVKEMIQHCVDANIDEAYKVSLLLLPPISTVTCVSSATWRGPWWLRDSVSLPLTDYSELRGALLCSSASQNQAEATPQAGLTGRTQLEKGLPSLAGKHEEPRVVGCGFSFFNMHDYFAFM